VTLRKSVGYCAIQSFEADGSGEIPHGGGFAERRIADIYIRNSDAESSTPFGWLGKVIQKR